jgi:streptogramin lyase
MLSKSQSAMEYLMTYGWAILIVAVVLGALYSLGIFNGANFLGGTCIAAPGYLCTNPLLSTDGTLSFTYGYQGPNVTIVGFACTNTTTEPSSFTASGSSSLEPGQEESVNATCTMSSSATIGTPFSGYIWVEYDQAGKSNLIERFATIRTAAAKGPVTKYIWIADYGSSKATKFSTKGVIVGNYPVGSSPRGLAIDNKGNVWVANQGGGSVTKLSSTGTLIGTYSVGSGTDPAEVAIDSNGNAWVTLYSENYVTELSSTGSIVGNFPVGGAWPFGIAIDNSGDIWVAVYNGAEVTKLTSTGSIIGNYPVAGDPYGVAADGSGHIWVAAYGGSAVDKLSSSGSVLGKYQFITGNYPYYIAVGNNGGAWVTLRSNNHPNLVAHLADTGNVILGEYPTSSTVGGVTVDSNNNAWVTAVDANGNNYLMEFSDTGALVGNYPLGYNTGADGDAIT